VEILKVGNPKKLLENLAARLQNVHAKIQGRKRMEIFVDCPPSHNSVVEKYLELVLNSVTEGEAPSVINAQIFPVTKLRTYLPNFHEGFIF